jgi:hypothetical protein
MAGRVYIVFNESLRSLKIGITGGSDGLRLGQHLREGWTALYERAVPTVNDARGVERSVLHELRVERALPPHLTSDQMPQGGWSETVSSDLVDPEELISLTDRIATEWPGMDGISGVIKVNGQSSMRIAIPDSRGGIVLGRIANAEVYQVTVSEDGVITLTPSVVISERELLDLTAVRPVLSPEEAFGQRGAVEAAQAVQDNRKARSAGDWGRRISTSADLSALIWGDAA